MLADFYGFLQIYHSYFNEKLRADKLASFTLAYKSSAVFVHKFLRACQTKFFDINSKQIKRFGMGWGEYMQKTLSYLNLFTDFNLLSCISRNRYFCASQQAQKHSFFIIICCLNKSP